MQRFSKKIIIAIFGTSAVLVAAAFAASHYIPKPKPSSSKADVGVNHTCTITEPTNPVITPGQTEGFGIRWSFEPPIQHSGGWLQFHFNGDGQVNTITQPTLANNLWQVKASATATIGSHYFGVSVDVDADDGQYTLDCGSVSVEIPGPSCDPNQGTVCYKSNVCSSAPTSGTIQCDGSCNAPDPQPLPQGYGDSCDSAANACNMTNKGTIACSGKCSASPPPDSSCAAPPPTPAPASKVYCSGTTQVTETYYACNVATKTAIGADCAYDGPAGDGGSYCQKNSCVENATACATVPPPPPETCYSGDKKNPGCTDNCAPIILCAYPSGTVFYDQNSCTYYAPHTGPGPYPAPITVAVNDSRCKNSGPETCEYPAPPDCEKYVPGPNYVQATNCGLILVPIPPSELSEPMLSQCYPPPPPVCNVNQGKPCDSDANSCGEKNSGTIQCSGSCSAVTPPVPTGYGQSCTKQNVCNSTSGTVVCDGSCSAPDPAMPENYGQTCQSSANACGMRNTGAITCGGTCSAGAPPDSDCSCTPQTKRSCGSCGGQQTCGDSGTWGDCSVTDPFNYGQTCQSSSNACGLASSGTVTCDGSCSVITPPANPPGYGNSCQSPANSCGETTPGSILCSGTCSAATAPPNNTCPGGGGGDVPTVSLTADGQDEVATISSGSSVGLAWTSAKADTCTALWTTSTNTSGTQNIGGLSVGEHLFSISCTGTGGSATDSVMVVVVPGGGGGGNPPPPPIVLGPPNLISSNKDIIAVRGIPVPFDPYATNDAKVSEAKVTPIGDGDTITFAINIVNSQNSLPFGGRITVQDSLTNMTFPKSGWSQQLFCNDSSLTNTSSCDGKYRLLTPSCNQLNCEKLVFTIEPVGGHQLAGGDLVTITFRAKTKFPAGLVSNVFRIKNTAALNGEQPTGWLTTPNILVFKDLGVPSVEEIK